MQALADQVEFSQGVVVDLDVEAADALASRAQIVLYQIIRESLDAALRRGPPTRISVAIGEVDGGAVETLITDDVPASAAVESSRRWRSGLGRSRHRRRGPQLGRGRHGRAYAAALHGPRLESGAHGRAGKAPALRLEATGYELHERDGELPPVGAWSSSTRGSRQEVNRLAPSPLPGDDRRAAYLQPLPGSRAPTRRRPGRGRGRMRARSTSRPSRCRPRRHRPRRAVCGSGPVVDPDPPSVCVTPARTRTRTRPPCSSTGAPASRAASTISPTVRSRTRSSSADRSTVNQARPPGQRATCCATSISDQLGSPAKVSEPSSDVIDANFP